MSPPFAKARCHCIERSTRGRRGWRGHRPCRAVALVRHARLPSPPIWTYDQSWPTATYARWT